MVISYRIQEATHHEVFKGVLIKIAKRSSIAQRPCKISQNLITTWVIMIILRYELPVISRIFITLITDYVEFHTNWRIVKAVMLEKHVLETVSLRSELLLSTEYCEIRHS